MNIIFPVNKVGTTVFPSVSKMKSILKYFKVLPPVPLSTEIRASQKIFGLESCSFLLELSYRLISFVAKLLRK